MDIGKVRKLLQQGDADTRREVVIALGKQREAQAIELLIAAVRDEDVGVHRAAVDALVQIGDAAVSPLVAALGEDGDQFHSRFTNDLCTVLARIGDPAIMPLLEAMTDQSARVCKRAVAALSCTSMMRVTIVELLLAALNDKREKIRQAAQTALIANFHWWPIETLNRALNETDGEIRERIIEMSGHKIERLEGEENSFAVELLASFLDDEDVGLAAAVALAGIGDGRALKRLNQLCDIPDANVRYSAVNALGKLGGKQAVELLIQALADSDVHVRLAAALALGKAGGTEAVRPLIGALADEEFSVRRYAIGALQQIGTLAVESLLAALESTRDEDALWAILWALRKIDDPRAQTAVETALETYGAPLSPGGKSQAGGTG